MRCAYHPDYFVALPPTHPFPMAKYPLLLETLRARMTVMGKDPVGEGKGIVIASHDLLDEEGRLVFSCLTRSVFSR